MNFKFAAQHEKTVRVQMDFNKRSLAYMVGYRYPRCVALQSLHALYTVRNMR